MLLSVAFTLPNPVTAPQDLIAIDSLPCFLEMSQPFHLNMEVGDAVGVEIAEITIESLSFFHDLKRACTASPVATGITTSFHVHTPLCI